MHIASNLMSKKRRLIFPLITLAVSYILILTFSKTIRNFFLPPKITANKIVGFAQYYGYPFYFDYLFLFIIILAPIIIVILFYCIFKIYDKEHI